MQTSAFLVAFGFIASLWLGAYSRPMEPEETPAVPLKEMTAAPRKEMTAAPRKEMTAVSRKDMTAVSPKEMTAKPKPSGPFHELLELLPLKEIDEIVHVHLQNDTGFRAAVKVLKSDAWLKLIEKVVATPEFKNFSNVAGKYFNITQASSCIIEFIKSLNTTEPLDKKVPADTPEPEPNLESFVTEIQKILPFGKFAKLLSADNPDSEFKKIREELATEENRQIALALHNAPDMVELRKSLKMMHFDIEPYISLIYSVLEWQLPE
ncbi:unnamed protein product [Ceutorhynchus assimilis]|uniref:Uncharacterized protein n=1 Tax=Ceutorhynchus assimilis TaxID=467358 RepID=A0A9N9QPK4_9CUCU|nr:unnamed protein product [Ceutorhynchus assimilis]